MCELLDHVTNHGAVVSDDLMHDIHSYITMIMGTTYKFEIIL